MHLPLSREITREKNWGGRKPFASPVTTKQALRAALDQALLAGDACALDSHARLVHRWSVRITAKLVPWRTARTP